MAIYRPDDFCHVIHIPVHLHPLGGTRCGKKEALERFARDGVPKLRMTRGNDPGNNPS